MGVNAGWEFVLGLGVSDAIIPGEVAETAGTAGTAGAVAAAVDTGESMAGGALIQVDVVDSC